MFNFAGTTYKQIVGIAVTPNIGVEVMLIDKKEGKVIKYANRPLEYNSSIREIADYTAFKSAVLDMFEQLDINKKSNVFVVLPNVYFGFINLPLILGDEAISNALTSEVEQSYLFKRTDPVTTWWDVNVNTQTDNRYIVYTALQKEAVMRIKDVFEEIGSNLVGVESSYSAIIRGIDFVGLEKDAVSEGQSWNILLINQNSYAIFSLTGNRLIEYNEVPMALKSFSYEEAYAAITTSVQQILPNYPALKLLIISQTDDISAEVLSTQLHFDGDLEFLDCNKYTKTPFLPVSLSITPKVANTISLSCVGAACYGYSNFPLDLNALGNKAGAVNASTLYFTITLFNKEILITPEFVRTMSMVIVGIVVVFFGIIILGLKIAVKKLDDSIALMEQNISTSEVEINKLKNMDVGVDINAIIDKVNEQNKKTITAYDSISVDIPKKLWLTYYYSSNGDKIGLKGNAVGIEDIYGYFKSLKTLNDATLRLNKLEILSDASEDVSDPENFAQSGNRLYDFEISTAGFVMGQNTLQQNKKPSTSLMEENAKRVQQQLQQQSVPPTNIQTPPINSQQVPPPLQPIEPGN